MNLLKNVFKDFIKQIEKRGLLKYFIYDTCYYDISRKVIVEKDVHYKLTSFEVKIFEHLLKNGDRVVKYEELLDIVESNNQKSLVSMIHKINKKTPTKTHKKYKRLWV